jgi:IS66 Orf2 like protein
MMLAHRKSRIWLARHRVDFRRHHDGLLAEAYKMSLDPFAGDIIIFVGKHRRAIKLLYADTTGLWLSWKKFTMEAMKTHVPFLTDPFCQSITAAELAMLMEGSSYSINKKVTAYTRAIDSGGYSIQQSKPQ